MSTRDDRLPAWAERVVATIERVSQGAGELVAVALEVALGIVALAVVCGAILFWAMLGAAAWVAEQAMGGHR